MYIYIHIPIIIILFVITPAYIEHWQTKQWSPCLYLRFLPIVADIKPKCTATNSSKLTISILLKWAQQPMNNHLDILQDSIDPILQYSSGSIIRQKTVPTTPPRLNRHILPMSISIIPTSFMLQSPFFMAGPFVFTSSPKLTGSKNITPHLTSSPSFQGDKPSFFPWFFPWPKSFWTRWRRAKPVEAAREIATLEHACTASAASSTACSGTSAARVMAMAESSVGSTTMPRPWLEKGLGDVYHIEINLTKICCMCVCIYIYMYIIYIYIYTYIHIYIYIYICVCVYGYICQWISVLQQNIYICILYKCILYICICVYRYNCSYRYRYMNMYATSKSIYIYITLYIHI